MQFDVESATDCGAFRANNEDAISSGRSDEGEFLWMVIADGMGGHQAGEVASEMLVSQVTKQVEALGRGSFPHGKLHWKNWIETAFVLSNSQILDAAENDSALSGMGTTGVILIVDAREYFIGWVGDSRAYHWHHNRLAQLTQDHSAIQYLLDKGSITADEARHSNSSHMLARAVGIKEKLEVDFVSDKLASGDVLLLSTDGLHDVLTTEILTAYLARFAGGQAVATDLINQALAQGSKDNITLGVVRIAD